MSRAAIYARFSSDRQRDASIEDQVRLCRERLERDGHVLVQTYVDRAQSGASMLRGGLQALIEDAMAAKFDVVVTEALDRLSRDQADIAGLFKRLSFAGVTIVTLAEGAINELHIGLKGTMNQLFLKDLADKTRRGLRGRVEAGRSGGGNAYGYDVVRAFAATGEPQRGERVVNEAEAQIVRRIFQAYAAGASPRAIAASLNAEGVRGPSGEAWGSSTLHGNPKRGTGILNNELYLGRLVWNRLRYVKDPATGKRVSRPNPPEAWITTEVPELRIIDDALWGRVKARQEASAIGPASTDLNRAHRPRYVFSGLLRCASCGGSLTMISASHVGCAAARNKGTCTNRRTFNRTQVEVRILNALATRLMDPALFTAFCEEYVAETNRLRAAASSEQRSLEAERERIGR